MIRELMVGFHLKSWVMVMSRKQDESKMEMERTLRTRGDDGFVTFLKPTINSTVFWVLSFKLL